MENGDKHRAPRNRTLTLTPLEHQRMADSLLRPPLPSKPASLVDQIVCADSLSLFATLPRAFVDLLILDPPYNLNKQFGAETFREMSLAEYESWFESWFPSVLPLLRPTASLYVCGDWKSSVAVHRVLDRHVIVRSRITWEREKGRGAKSNWKNASEDIWFATVSNNYFFDVEAVKLKRRVIAPYRVNGEPKDWQETENGDFRLTHPSNLWTDLTVPFWSMPENTDHPTQKPEKLLAKLLLASSRKGDFVFDPFLGSGTTVVVARKFGRRFLGVEMNEHFACLAAKRVELANDDPSVQGYAGGVFWERNSLNAQPKEISPVTDEHPMLLETGTPYRVTKSKTK
ncbi:MAG: site-specific DNA-methyltransferase [Verrucomicrobia bacterium]|jgi:site-specific DNA-methyltransferase (adenine-specific)|nr:site-specific DNA-methyltransferase [Verrucomicrobiota bacterium]